MLGTFLKQNQSAHSTTPILKRVDRFNMNTKVKDIFKTNRICLIDIPCLVMRQLISSNWFELKVSSI